MSKRIATSETDPISVDFIQAEEVGLPGRLGMTFAPGKKGDSYHSNLVWDRSVMDDIDRLVDVEGMDVLVSLMEEHEYSLLKMDNFFDYLDKRKVQTIHYPIRDVSVPESTDRDSFFSLVAQIRELLAAGRTVVTHCRGGKGRTGLVAAAVLAAGGVPVEDAIAKVRLARPGTIETRQQENYVRELAEENS